MKMIIADDEVIIVRGIQKLVNWGQYGIEVAGTYYDGKSALENILRIKPDVALLDICMPGISGIEILKQCREFEVNTKVIFFSGFENFEYARTALQLGAVDYLLKPVNKNDLLKAIEKAVRTNIEFEIEAREKSGRESMAIESDGENDENYIPVCVNILYSDHVTESVKKLTKFSVYSFIEDYVQKNNYGICFQKKGTIAIVLKNLEMEDVEKILYELGDSVKGDLNQKLAYFIGRKVSNMNEIPDEYEKCRELEKYLYFMNQDNIPTLYVGKIKNHLTAHTQYNNMISHFISMVLAKKDEQMQKDFEELIDMISCLSEGKQEDACFYFNTIIRSLNEKITELGIHMYQEEDMQKMMRDSRVLSSYRELCDFYRSKLKDVDVWIGEMTVTNDHQNYLQAKKYIDEHYSEQLSLEIVANHIYMNATYFSTFFKKHNGRNFKEYVSSVRIEHALKLLITTDLKAYAIANEVGFSDARTFSETFQHFYHETPNAYRKNQRK